MANFTKVKFLTHQRRNYRIVHPGNAFAAHYHAVPPQKGPSIPARRSRTLCPSARHAQPPDPSEPPYRGSLLQSRSPFGHPNRWRGPSVQQARIYPPIRPADRPFGSICRRRLTNRPRVRHIRPTHFFDESRFTSSPTATDRVPPAGSARPCRRAQPLVRPSRQIRYRPVRI